jgi:son of sevenless-like protein
MMAAGQNDYGQVLHTFFCRALYDYQSNDLSSLSFKKGNIIEVLTQLESGWWDGLLNEERGWFPSNYVVQITDQEAAAELLNPGPLPSKSFSEQDSEWLADEVEYRQFKGADPAALRGSNGATVESWVPEVTSDGQVCLGFDAVFTF